MRYAVMMGVMVLLAGCGAVGAGVSAGVSVVSSAASVTADAVETVLP